MKSIPTGRWRQPLIQGMESLNKIGQGVSYEETDKGKIMIVPSATATHQGAITDDEESVGNINNQTTSESTQFNASLTFSDDDGTRDSSLDEEYEAWSSVSDEGCHCMALYDPPLEHFVSR